MSQPTTLDIHIQVQAQPLKDGEQSMTGKVTLHVNGEQIGFVSRLRVDADSNEVIPRIEIDMLRGVALDLLDVPTREKAQAFFDLLRECPGVIARMPAPRNG